MPTTLKFALRQLMRDWKDDLGQEWCSVLENVELDFDASGGERELGDGQSVFPGRRQRSSGPGSYHMFRAFDDLPPSAVKVVLMGQDPYTDAARATGRSFEDGSRACWLRSDGLLDSMVRIAQQLASYLSGCNEYSARGTGVRTLQDHLGNGSLVLASPSSVFDLWQEQGVLMLNTALTYTNEDDMSYHQRLWSPIVKRICDRLARRCQSVVFLCFGRDAERLFDSAGIRVHLITNNRLVVRGHPRAGGLYGNGGFLGEENIFREANARWAASGGCPIVWHRV